MDKAHLDRLIEVQEKGLENVSEKIEKWEKFKKDYELLQDRLHTLPDKISYDVMVPFGSMALIPGKLVHTNELFVLLGENYFVERSAKQATEIAGRRIKQCETMLSNLLKEKEQLQNWRKYTGEIHGDDLVEIIEEYDPEKEKAWRERHRKNVQAYHRKLAEEMQLAEQDTSNSNELSPVEERVLKDSEIQARLSYLETVEEKNDELADDEQESDESSEFSESTSSEGENTTVKKGIKWKDRMYTKKNTINFTHTAVVTSDEESNQEEDEPDRNQLSTKPVPAIQSPSDIYKDFTNNIKTNELPKSILKIKSSEQVTDKARILFMDDESTPIVNDTNIYPVPKCPSLTKRNRISFEDSVGSEPSKPAFSDTVQEKATEVKKPSQSPQGTKRMSKFKVQRMSGKI